MVGVALCDDKLGKLLKFNLFLTPELKKDKDCTEEGGYSTGYDRLNYYREKFRKCCEKMDQNTLGLHDGSYLSSDIYRPGGVWHRQVRFEKDSLALFLVYSQVGYTNINGTYLARIHSFVATASTEKSQIKRLPFSDNWELVGFDSERVALVLDGKRSNCCEDLIKVYLVSVRGPLDLDERRVTLSQFGEDSEFVSCIKAEDYRAPDITRINGLVFSFVGQSYMSILNLGDLDKPQVLSFKLIDGQVLNWNMRMAGCEGIRALFCPGMNGVTLVKTKKEEVDGDELLSSEQKFIEMASDDKGIFSLSDLSINSSGSLLKLDNGNMLFLGGGGKGVVSDSNKKDKISSQELQGDRVQP